MTESSGLLPEKHDRSSRLSQLMLQVVERQSSGERVDDQGLIESNPELMPELGERLHAFRAIQEAEVSAKSRPDHDILTHSEHPNGCVQWPRLWAEPNGPFMDYPVEDWTSYRKNSGRF